MGSDEPRRAFSLIAGRTTYVDQFEDHLLNMQVQIAAASRALDDHDPNRMALHFAMLENECREALRIFGTLSREALEAALRERDQ